MSEEDKSSGNEVKINEYSALWGGMVSGALTAYAGKLF